MIEVEHLTRRFGSLLAVDDVSFTVERGEVVGFLGPNGAGKTTTMRILTGYLPASSGAARIGGHDVMRESLEVRKRIGYLPEAVPLYREHRVVEMLQLQARLHRLSRADTKRRIGEVLERVGLADRARDLVGNLSRGLRQRAGLAVALLPDPEVLILDEPTSGLDPLQRIEVRELIRELASEHTVLLSSHILPEVEAVAPRVVIIHRGKIAADGPKEALVAELAGSSVVRVEAFVGGAAADALRLFAAIEGVERVVDRGRLGIHHQFELVTAEDLREDVGALCAQQGWALRELSFRRPTLEELFARIALDIDDPAGAAKDPAGAADDGLAAAPVAAQGLGVEGPAPAASGGMRTLNPFEAAAPPAAEKAPDRVVYNLNPFDQGAARDLSKPKADGDSGTSEGGGLSIDGPDPGKRGSDSA